MNDTRTDRTRQLEVEPRDAIAAVTHRDPYPFYARLVAERPLDYDSGLGLWVAASAEAVAAVLASDAGRVRPSAEPVPGAIAGTPAGEVFGRLVRMTDGDGHRRLKPAVSAAFATIDAGMAAEVSHEHARRLLAGPGPLRSEEELEDFTFRLPVHVVASLLGVPPGRLEEAASWTRDLAASFAAGAGATQAARGGAAAGKLLDLLRPGASAAMAALGSTAMAALGATAIAALGSTAMSTAVTAIGSTGSAAPRSSARTAHQPTKPATSGPDAATGPGFSPPSPPGPAAVPAPATTTCAAAGSAGPTSRGSSAPAADRASGTCPGGLLAELSRQASGSEGCDGETVVANAVGFLFQACEATAGLIGNTLVSLARHAAARDWLAGDPGRMGDVIAEVLRHDPPVQNTRRFIARSCLVAGREMREGDTVLVLLAAAGRDPAVCSDPHTFHPARHERRLFTFGAAAHRCPGQDLASTIARAAIAELLAAGLDLEPLAQPVAYRPSANLRIPVFHTGAT